MGIQRFANETVFVENSTYPRHRLKERILKEDMISYICDDCGIGPEWNGKELILQLEHKNGVNDDKRLENLCFLCPNCHTQTNSYAAKNKTNPLRKPKRNYKPVKCYGSTSASKPESEGSTPSTGAILRLLMRQ